MTAPDVAATVATGRTPGYDVARAFALFGMVVVNFHGRVEADHAWWDITEAFIGQLEGRSAALFVMLAGLGVSLRSRKAREAGGEVLRAERASLTRRALALFGLGLLNLHLWDWDILHVYGLYLTFAAGLIGASFRVLFGVTALVYVSAMVLRFVYPFPYEPIFWTPSGLFQSMVFVGNYPALPWLCFLIAGLALGRLDLRQELLRRQVLAVSGAVFGLTELLSMLVARLAEADGMDDFYVQWLSTWPRPPGPFFVVAAGAAAIWVIAASVEWSESGVFSRFVMPLTATGQLALTLYFAHEVAILIPMDHYLFDDKPVEAVLAWAVVCCLAGVAGAVWWRKRNRQGPLESILRQISTRARPAWGGGLMEK